MDSALHLTNQDLKRLFPAWLCVNAQGVILEAGPSLAHHLKKDIAGASLLDEFVAERPIRTNSVQDILTNNQPVLLRHRAQGALALQGLVLKGGSSFQFLVSHVPVADPAQSGLKYRFADFGSFDGAKDMFLASRIRAGLLTDAKDLVERLQREKRSVEAASNAKSEFLACMSHEIRTPLNGVLGLGALLKETTLDEDQGSMLDGMLGCGMSLLTILNDIIDTSKMDASQLTIDKSVFRLSELTEHVRTGYSFPCRQKSIQLEIHLEPQLSDLLVTGDVARIQQILGNLVSNALKFTETGRIAVRIEGEGPYDDAQVSVRFSVIDTGIGISEENQQRVFEAFVQADAGIYRQFGGTGLGLSICKRLSEAMGGGIELHSELGKGSTFSFWLPLDISLESEAVAG